MLDFSLLPLLSIPESFSSSCFWAFNCFAIDSKELSSILNCFGDQITNKNTKTYTKWLEIIAKVFNMLIGLKGNNYYSKVFKRVNYKLSNSTFWVVISQWITFISPNSSTPWPNTHSHQPLNQHVWAKHFVNLTRDMLCQMSLLLLYVMALGILFPRPKIVILLGANGYSVCNETRMVQFTASKRGLLLKDLINEKG